MTKRMLIDASHSEETRVVVVNGSRLEEFDFESSTKKQLKGTVYLAKVTRVEPSLQAAFVEYGGNRHGFLAFSEIHPDYYQIPIADREALLQQETEEVAAEASDEEAGAPAEGESDVETVSGEDVDDVDRGRAALNRAQALRKYKIQEVIKRRQILLVQVVKEERGNKGAALTTYLSLAGRYCVLMPNTPRGGGISRKIVDPVDRKRLKQITGSLPVDSHMGVIVRTAGMSRTKAEIKRDFDYLLRFWNDIREKTLKSTAPTLIHEEANLIKRSLRDLYTNDIDEILVEGEDGYKTSKDFMRMLIPSHARKIKRYGERVPMFINYQIENQLDELHRPEVELKSGGSIVINPTEALVAIDVNSGRATKGRNIEETAKKTNLEAAGEIARQLRLRDLAGLIVIDFIDMGDRRNDRLVEKCVKDALKSDRARIQVGRISPFGLLEFSRQRLRPSFLELNTSPCTACGGSGVLRSVESSALQVLRAIEEEGIRKRSDTIEVALPGSVALYILNHKRSSLNDIEGRYELRIAITGDDSLVPPNYRIGGAQVADASSRRRDEERSSETEGRSRRRRRSKEPVVETETEPSEIPAEAAPPETQDETEGGETAPRKRRRRGRRGGRRRSGAAREAGGVEASEVTAAETVAAEPAPETEAQAPEEAASDEVPTADAEVKVEASDEAEKKPKRTRRSPRRKAPAKKATAEVKEAEPETANDDAESAKAGSEPVDGGSDDAATADNSADTVPEVAPEAIAAEDGTDKPRRRGWWQRGDAS
jgi:ribonuclease E